MAFDSYALPLFLFHFFFLVHFLLYAYLFALFVRWSACVQNKVYHVWLIINFWSFWLIPLALIVRRVCVCVVVNSEQQYRFLTPVINDFCGYKSYSKFKWVLLDYKRTRAPSHNRNNTHTYKKKWSACSTIEIHWKFWCCFAPYSIIIRHISF